MKTRISLIALLFVASVLVTGCQEAEKTEDGQEMQVIESTPVDLEKAALQKKIDSRFENPKAHFELGQLYRYDAIFEKAFQEYQVTLQLQPGHKGAQAAMVKSNFEVGNNEKAKILADIYINQSKGSAKSSLLLGNALQKEGLDDYALICYENALMLAPNSAALHRQMAYYYKRKGDTARTQEYFKRSFQLNPYNSEVAGELGKLGIAVEIPRERNSTTDKYEKILEEGNK